MRVLLAIVLAAAAAWSGWWWWNASSRERAVEAWLAERRAAGWIAEAADVSVSGYPNRVDLTVTALDLADPREGWAWSAPFFQILSLTWSPQHFIAVWPSEQTVSTPYDTARIESSQMRGSVVFVPGLALELDRSTIDITDLAITGNGGWEASLARALVSTRRGEGGTAGRRPYDLSVRADGLALPEDWIAGLDVGGLLPARMETAELDATLTFDRAWDRHSVEGESPALEGVTVRDLRLAWGRLDLRARGEVVADLAGLAEGELTLRMRNWEEMLAIAVNADLIGSGTARAIETGLGLLARLGGGRDTIEVPLRFEGGRTYLASPFGAVAVGDAPRLTGRR
jgi:hypothetical protein